MGFHTCEYCHKARSSTDIILWFPEVNRAYMMPKMIVHYIEEHFWKAQSTFIKDVKTQIPEMSRDRVRETNSMRIGYLSGAFTCSFEVDYEFIAKLRKYIEQTELSGNARVTRGLIS